MVQGKKGGVNGGVAGGETGGVNGGETDGVNGGEAGGETDGVALITHLGHAGQASVNATQRGPVYSASASFTPRSEASTPRSRSRPASAVRLPMVCTAFRMLRRPLRTQFYHQQH